MAFPQIETGYKPEFGLGALYQGFNAGNNDQMAQLEILKQFLANQHAQNQNPIDEAQAQQTLDAGRYKTTPEHQTGMRDTISGQGMSNLAAGQTAQGLQPSKQAAGQAELEAQGAKEGLFANMFRGIAKQHDQSLPEAQREAGGQGAYFLADTMSRVDPKIMAQERMLGSKLGSAEDINDAKLANARALAGLKSRAVAGDKTAQQAIVGHWAKQLAQGSITQDQYVAEISELQAAISAAKVQQGTVIDSSVAPGVIKDKDPQKVYVPGAASGTNKPDPLGIR